LLKAFKDPDHYFCRWWSRGVWLGSTERPLPRAPALFDRKTRWTLPEIDKDVEGVWRSNYSSTVENLEKVEEQFREEVELDMMTTMSLDNAIELYEDDLSLAATGAIVKNVETGEVRVIYDASNGVLTNYRIRVRDQLRSPTAPDLKAVMGACAEEGGPHFQLKFDVSKAHRRVPTLEEEWGRQACQLRGTAAESLKRAIANAGRGTRRHRNNGRFRITKELFTQVELQETVYLNTVNTFGVGSAGYWWGRGGSAIIRLAHYMLGHEDALWSLLYADDGLNVGRTGYFERGLIMHLFVLVLLGLPLSWKKFKGGVTVEWVGYWLDAGRFEVGVTASRARWCVHWLEDRQAEGRVQLGELREALGRIQFVAGPLEHLRPFLGPLYAWACSGAKFGKPVLPVMLRLILGYLAKELKEARTSNCRLHGHHAGEVFRLDAKAEGEKVSVGGWLTKGGLKAKEAPWFAVELTRSNAPWAFARGDAFRVIASLELLGALVGIMVLMPIRTAAPPEFRGEVPLSCGTDNRGNSFLLDKMLTTKYPLGLVLMELSHQMRRRSAILRATWLPRLQNEEADALTNLDFRHFDLKKRIQVDVKKLDFHLLNDLLDVGDAYVKELQTQQDARKAEEISGGRTGRKRKRLAGGQSLRERDPWTADPRHTDGPGLAVQGKE